MQIFESLESAVRSYCRSFPTVFTRATGSTLVDEHGRRYLDFFSGAGVLAYGHNNPRLKRRLLDYLEQDGVTHGLDMATAAKGRFLERFASVVLEPRQLDYKIQFPGPTGTNAVEAALKLARLVTGRQAVVYFHRAFHGMTLGSLAVTSNPAKRAGAGVPLRDTVPMPFDGDTGPGEESFDQLERLLDGAELPAAVIVETVQAEGGVRAASLPWLRQLESLLRERGVLFIVDDIQVGCGRTGTFFSFEPAGLYPDIVCLSKAISGFGLPMALVLLRPELDVWKPGQHNGTFRGNNLAFVTAEEALSYWQDDDLSRDVGTKAERVRQRLGEMADRHAAAGAGLRGRGLIQGLALAEEGAAPRVSAAAFERGLIIETAGPRDKVLKILPPLVIDPEELEAGLDRLEEALEATLTHTVAGDRVAV